MTEINKNYLRTAWARRAFLKASGGLGALALTELMGGSRLVGQTAYGVAFNSYGVTKQPRAPPTAKRVTRSHMTTAGPQRDTFDYKPMVEKTHGQQSPPSVRGKDRL